MPTRRAILIGSVASLAAGAARADAVVALDTSGGRCVATVLLDGHPARMIIDTGAELTVLARSAVARLGLGMDAWVGTTLRGAGGLLEDHANAVVHTATLAGAGLFQRAPGLPLSMPVTSADLAGADGLLGGDVLRHYTLDLDVPGARLALLPAAAAAGGVRLKALRRALLLAPLSLDGHALTALVDTGASSSLINARGLYRLGLTREMSEHDRAVSASGLGGRFAARMHGFNELRLGPMAMPAPALLTDPIAEPAFDMLLGLDVLGRRRLLLSYATLTLAFP